MNSKIMIKRVGAFMRKFLFLAPFLFEGFVLCEVIDTTSISFEKVFETREIAKKPGTLLYESAKFNLQDKYNTVSVTGLNLELPAGTKEVTWSVEFMSLGAGSAGLLLYDPPTVGKSYNDFWEKTNKGWELKFIGENANYAARLAGVPDGKNDQKIVYENAKTSLGKTYLSGNEVGDSVVLDGSISELTGIQFEYYASLSSLGGNPQGKIRIYLNDGASIKASAVSGDPRGNLELGAREAVIYDNPRGEKDSVYFISDEVGDSFLIESQYRIIRKIQFEYFAALNPFEENQMGILRVYSNDGDMIDGSNSPNTLLFESDSFGLKSGYNMVTISDIAIELPEDINNASWTLEFSGLGLLSQAGLMVHDKMKTGQSEPSFWSKNQTGDEESWKLMKIDGLVGNFCMRMIAQMPSPPVITTDQESYVEGEVIKVSFANGPKNSKDWIGIYGVEMIPGSVVAPDWSYVNGTRIAGEGLSDGAIVFFSQLPIGDYVARFFQNDSYNEIANYPFKVIPPPIVMPAKPIFDEREKVVVNFNYGPGNAKDWIAIYQPETDPTKLPSLSWAYVGGSRTVGEALGKGTVLLSDNLAVGNYVIRYFENDSYKQLAESSFAVKDSIVPVINLKGSTTITISTGETYVDPGATASDNLDGDITPLIKIINPVDTSKSGVYIVTYNVSDASGNDAVAVTRTVKVIASQIPKLSIIYKSNGSIIVSFEGNLETSSSVNGPWIALDGVGEIVLQSDHSKQFFRAVN